MAKRAGPHIGDVSVPQCDQVSFVSPRRERLAKGSFQRDAQGDALSNEKLKCVFQEDNRKVCATMGDLKIAVKSGEDVVPRRVSEQATTSYAGDWTRITMCR